MIRSVQLLSRVGPIHVGDFVDHPAVWFADELDGTRVRVSDLDDKRMGRPEEITVTIEPGDTLNGDRGRWWI